MFTKTEIPRSGRTVIASLICFSTAVITADITPQMLSLTKNGMSQFHDESEKTFLGAVAHLEGVYYKWQPQQSACTECGFPCTGLILTSTVFSHLSLPAWLCSCLSRLPSTSKESKHDYRSILCPVCELLTVKKRQ